MRNKTWLYIFCMLLLVRVIYSIPVPSTEFYGLVTINNTNATIGINVTAYDPNGTLCGKFTVVNTGYYGLMSCNSDDTTTWADEGARTNDLIAFYVNGSRAVTFGNDTAESGLFRWVNLSLKNYPPYFTHPFPVIIQDEGDRLLWDVNCSDLNVEDNLTYYDNTTVFNISLTTGLINWVPRNWDVYNHSVVITCSDGRLNVSDTLRIIVIDTNNAPVLDPIGNLIALDGVLFEINITASDEDNDTLEYFTNSTLFTIDNNTGMISFTPLFAQIGNHTINISVSDGSEGDYELIRFTIVRGPYCGDLICNALENCVTCAGDCDACPEAPPGEGDAGGDGGDGAGAGGAALFGGGQRVCFERWECTEWSTCSAEGTQIRKCVDRNKCDTQKNKPAELQSCEYIGTCFDNILNQNEEQIDCGGICKPCPQTCFDKILNQDEEQVDCGGICKPCAIDRFAPTYPKLAPFAKAFPWWLLLLVVLLLLSTVVGDKIYLKNVEKKDLDEFRKKMHTYKKIRLYIYFVSAIFTLLGVAYIIFIYLTSNQPEVLVRFFLMPLILVIGLLLVVIIGAIMFRQYQQSRTKKARLWFLEEIKRKREIITKEDILVKDLESKVILRINTMRKNNEFIDELKPVMSNFEVLLRDIYKVRNERLGNFEISPEIMDKLGMLCKDPILAELAKDHPKFKILLSKMRVLKDSKEVAIKEVQYFLISMLDIKEDAHLEAVIASSKACIDVYNQVVEVYETYRDELYHKIGSDDVLAEAEAKFMRKVDQVTGKPVMGRIRGNAKYISLYNSMVDIYNHYKEKQDMAMDEKNTKMIRR